MMKLKKYLAIILMFITCCQINSKDVFILNGQYINVKTTFANPGDVISYEIWNSSKKDSQTSIFLTKIDSLHNFGSLKFHSESNKFIATHDNYAMKKIFKSDTFNIKYLKSVDLVLCDNYGKILKYIYKARDGEQVYKLNTSMDNNVVFFLTSDNTQSEINDIGNLNIYNFSLKKITLSVPNFCIGLRQEVSDNSFNIENNKLIFSIKDEPIMTFHESVTKPNVLKIDSKLRVNENGIYIYNMENDELEMILDKGHKPIWNPKNNNEFVYIGDKRNEIFIHSLVDNSNRRICVYDETQIIKDIYFSPDAKNLLVIGWDDRFWSNCYFENIIDFETGMKIKHKIIGIGATDFTWRK